MGMTGRFARQQIKVRANAFWRDHWRWALPGVVGLCVLAGAVGLLIPVSFPMWVVYPLLVLAVLSSLRPMFYGTYYLEMGAEAEAWTSKELRKACGPGWHVIDGVSFAFHDVDHVLVGPSGVYAIETKYTDSSIDMGTAKGQEWATRWASQAVEGARSIRLLLRDLGIDHVYPGVIAWGSEISGNPRFIEGVPVLRRRDLQEEWMPWRRKVSVLTTEEIRLIVRKLAEYRNVRMEYARRLPNAA